MKAERSRLIPRNTENLVFSTHVDASCTIFANDIAYGACWLACHQERDPLELVPGALSWQVLLENLDRMPGDSRTRIGFLTYNGTLHFYRLSEGLAQPQMMIISDIDGKH